MKAPGDTDFPFGAIPAFIYISSLKQEGGRYMSFSDCKDVEFWQATRRKFLKILALIGGVSSVDLLGPLNRRFGLTTLILFIGFLSAECTSFAQVPPLEPGKVVESKGITAKKPLSQFAVTVYVILQIHRHPVAERRAHQDVGRVTACQEGIVSTVLSIAQKGAPTVVVEGLYFKGTLDKPEPIIISEVPRTDQIDAKWVLANRRDLVVYGFEIKSLNDFAVWVANGLGKSAGRAAELSKETGPGTAQSKKEIDNLTQDEVTRLNLWWAATVPERSFLALQTALAVALARREKQVQLVIGKEHWNDLVYAANRHDNVHIRLVPYVCP